jgi:hypothetical protein
MIDSVYTEYFHKSKTFVYPLIEIKRGVAAVPENTYLCWKNMIYLNENKFICEYRNRKDDEFVEFEKKYLTGNKYYHDLQIVDQSLIYVFDLSEYTSDLQHIIKGKYSKINEHTKRKILDFHKKNRDAYVYIESFLYPVKFFPIYSRILNVEAKLLKEVGELCSKPDIIKETYTGQIQDVNNFINLSKPIK